MKTFKIYSDCHIKNTDFLTENYFKNPSHRFFRGTHALSVGFKMKTL